MLPVEARAGVLSAAEAAAVTAEVRSTARDALAADGVAVSGAEGTPATALQAGAALALFGRAARLEGATVIAVGAYQAGSVAPAAVARVVGIGLDQLRAEIRAKVPGLVRTALGLASAAPEAPPAKGTLRLPAGTSATAAAPPVATPPVAAPPVAAPSPAPPEAAPSAGAHPSAAPPSAAPRANANESALVALIREVTSDVEALRGLRRKQNLKILVLDDKLFAAALREKVLKDLTPAIVAAERARWTAFALAPPGLDPGQVLLGVLDEQVAGFYDPFSKQLIVRKDAPGGPEALRVVLAHEIEHALQDQNFGIPDLRLLPDDDVRLARTALYEGDAMVVMTAYGARRGHQPVKAAISGGAALMRAVDTEALLRMSGKSPALLEAPAILREELVFPYTAGFGLVAEVYRRGGFALVDKMFRSPPVSTHQLIHPEAYFAGEQPAAVPFPPAPPGTRIVATGRMGELGARVAMEVCVDRAVVKDFVKRWQGDAYTIVAGPKGALSLFWTSAWSGDGAREVANLLQLEQPCWEESALPGTARIAAAGEVVAVSRGAGELGAVQAKQLTTQVRPPPPSPPLGDVPAPAPPAPPSVAEGKLLSPRLALHAEVPDGYALEASDPAVEFAIRREKAGSALLSFVPEPLAGEALENFFQRTSSPIATALGGRLSLVESKKRTLLGATEALERTWTIEGAATRLRIDLAPACAGKATLLLVRIESGSGAQETLERFATSIKSTGLAPACAELD